MWIGGKEVKALEVNCFVVTASAGILTGYLIL
jgi:hypothetical protein